MTYDLSRAAWRILSSGTFYNINTLTSRANMPSSGRNHGGDFPKPRRKLRQAFLSRGGDLTAHRGSGAVWHHEAQEGAAISPPAGDAATDPPLLGRRCPRPRRSHVCRPGGAKATTAISTAPGGRHSGPSSPTVAAISPPAEDAARNLPLPGPPVSVTPPGAAPQLALSAMATVMVDKARHLR